MDLDGFVAVCIVHENLYKHYRFRIRYFDCINSSGACKQDIIKLFPSGKVIIGSKLGVAKV